MEYINSNKILNTLMNYTRPVKTDNYLGLEIMIVKI